MSNFSESHGRLEWGTGATIGFSLVCWLAMFVAQLLAVVAIIWVRHNGDAQIETSDLAESLINDGAVLGVATIFGAIIGIGLVLVIIKLRRGASVSEYLALVPISRKTLGYVIAITAGFIVVSDSLSFLLGRPIVPQFMVEAYQTRTWPVLFWVAVVVAGPALEEIFFRGFIFAGLRKSRLGDIGSIAVISLVWALFHTQYGIFDITSIFFIGILFGAIRIKTGSLWSTFAMHVFANFVATTETALYVSKVMG